MILKINFLYLFLNIIYWSDFMLIKVCPRCGSDDIVWIIPQNWSMWECNNCDYTGAIIEVDEDVQKEIQSRWNEQKDVIADDSCEDDFDNLSDEEFEKKLDELFSQN